MQACGSCPQLAHRQRLPRAPPNSNVTAGAPVRFTREARRAEGALSMCAAWQAATKRRFHTASGPTAVQPHTSTLP
jgi:hypothetical protein